MDMFPSSFFNFGNPQRVLGFDLILSHCYTSMMPRNREHTGIFIEKSTLLANATRSFETKLDSGKISPAGLSQYVTDYVIGVKKHGVDILILGEDWNDKHGQLSTYAKQYIQASETKIIVTEYFEPEIQRYVERSPLRGLLKKVMSRGYRPSRFRFANDIAEECKQTAKPIAVADIANKPLYEAEYIVSSAAPIALVPLSVFFPAVSVGGLLTGVMSITNRCNEVFFHKGMFDKDKIHKEEKYMLDAEDARRVYTAAGIEQLATEYITNDSNSQKEQPNSQIVVIYPKTHAIRIADYLVHPPYLKQSLYQTFPLLDRQVRQYAWKDSVAKLTGNEELAHWERYSNRTISNT